MNNARLSTICHLTRLLLRKGDEFYCHGHNFRRMNCFRYQRREIVYNKFASSDYIILFFGFISFTLYCIIMHVRYSQFLFSLFHL